MKTNITCPKCDHEQEEEIPSSSCVPFYRCNACSEIVSAQEGDCCVFCSYAEEKCFFGRTN